MMGIAASRQMASTSKGPEIGSTSESPETVFNTDLTIRGWHGACQQHGPDNTAGLERDSAPDERTGLAAAAASLLHHRGLWPIDVADSDPGPDNRDVNKLT